MLPRIAAKADPPDGALSMQGAAGVDELALLLFGVKNVFGQYLVEVGEALDLLGGLLNEEKRQRADVVGQLIGDLGQLHLVEWSAG